MLPHHKVSHMGWAGWQGQWGRALRWGEHWPWWGHHMERLSTSLDHCDGYKHIMAWKHFLHYWVFVRESTHHDMETFFCITQPLIVSPHSGPVMWISVMFSLFLASTRCRTKSKDAGDLRCQDADGASPQWIKFLNRSLTTRKTKISISAVL